MNIVSNKNAENGSSSAGHAVDAKLRAKYAEQLSKLRTVFRSGKPKTHAWRISQLKAMKRLLTENEGAIKEAMAADLGRGYFEAVGLEIVPMMMEIDHAIQHLEGWMKPVYTPVPAMIEPAVSEYVYEPYGVVLIIGAFNYPILLSLSPLIGALLAGNCAVLKPSEVSKASEKLMVDLLPQYLDTECVAVVTGGVETNTALLDLAWDKIMFTGSTRVGRIVAMAAAKHLTPVTLELGGKSPTIVDASCTNLELAARRIVWGKISNAGQTCIAPDYVLCHVSKYDAFMAAAVKVLKTFVGPDAKTSEHYARIVSTQHCERLKSLLADPKSGTAVVGGAVDVANRYVEPTILKDVKYDSKVMSEEIFGPILPVLTYKTTEELVEIINRDGLEKPLALYIFAKDRGMIDKVVRACPSGGVVINDVVFHFLNHFVPFGGVGSSGQGGYHGFYSFEVFSHRRGIVRRDDSDLFDLSIRYPPYSKAGLSLFVLASKLPSFPSVTGMSFTIGCISVGLLSFAAAYFTGLARTIDASDAGTALTTFAKKFTA